MKKILAFLLFLSPIASAGVWDATTPAGTDPINQGDDRIREMKTAIAESFNRTSSGVFPGTNPATAPLFQWTLQQGANASKPTTNLQHNQLYYSSDTFRLLQYSSQTAAWNTIAVGMSTSTNYVRFDASTASFTTGGIITSGNITSDGNITTTGDDVDITTHVAITGNLSVGGNLVVTGSFNPSVTHISSYLNATTSTDGSGTLVLLDDFTDIHDSLGEMGSTTFTVTTSGYYQICYRAIWDMDGSPASVTLDFEIFKNGSSYKWLTLNNTIDPVGSGTLDDGACQTFSLTAADLITFKISSITSDTSDVTVGSATAAFPTISIDRMP